MATLVLGAVGSALGAGFGGTILGFSGAAIGGFIGSTIGSVVDNWIVGSLMPNQRIEGARLESLRVTSSTEGTAIPRIFGRMRVGGNLIWATDFTETFRTEEQGGGKGGGRVQGPPWTRHPHPRRRLQHLLHRRACRHLHGIVFRRIH